MERFYQVLQEALLALGRFARSLEEASRAWNRARREFFGFPRGEEKGAPREGRFLEWFCLERGLEEGPPPLAAFLKAGMPGLPGGRPQWLDRALRENRFGFFRVEQVLPEGEILLRPPSGEAFRLYWPKSSRDVPAPGNTLLGRIYPFEGTGREDLYFPSPWTILYQGGDLVEVLERDLERARAEGMKEEPGQKELEAMLGARFLGRGEGGDGGPLGPELSLPDLLERIQLLFDRHGFVGVTAEEVAEEAREAESFSQAFGEFLDQLAFETDADLEEARRLFLQLWARLKEPPREEGTSQEEEEPGPEGPPAQGSVAARPWTDPEAPCPCGSGLPYEACHMGRDLVARLEEAEARKEKLGPVVAGLGKALGGLGDDRGEDPFTAREEGLAEARALVEEFLWEKGLDRESPPGRSLGAYLAHLEKRSHAIPPLRAEDLVGDPAREWILSRFLELADREEELERFLSGPAREISAFGKWLASDHGLEGAAEGARYLEETYLSAFRRARRARAGFGGEEALPEGAGERVLLHAAREGEGDLFLARGFPPAQGEPLGERIDPGRSLPEELRPGDLVLGVLLPEGRLAGPIRVVPAPAVPYLEG